MRRDRMTTPVEEVERPALVWQRPDGEAGEYNVWPERPVTIGRDATNTIAIDSPFVSKAHAIFQYANGEYVIEDLKSANGTKLNGAPISVSVVKPGDVIELGDQRIRFVDRAVERPAQAAGGAKTFRLAAVALLTAIVMIALMMMLVSGPGSARRETTPGPARDAAPGTAKPVPAAAAGTAAVSSPIVQDVVTHAERAGVRLEAALLDAGTIQMRTGRLREAVQLFAAAVARNPSEELARTRLASSTSLLEQAIEKQTGEAERAFVELRFADAAAAWEQVVQLTDPADPRHKAAEDGWKRAKEKIAR